MKTIYSPACFFFTVMLLFVSSFTQATITVTIAGNNCSCAGVCNGSAMASPTGGSAPYTYSWSSGGSTTPSLNNLCPGTYTCAVTDGVGGSGAGTVTITQPVALAGTVTTVNASCTAPTGTATAAVTGGTSPYTYSWSPSPGAGQGTAAASGLAGGTYTLTITDKNNCTTTVTAIVSTDAAPSASITNSLNIYCFGACTGSATITGTGGTVPYTYSWAPAEGTTNKATGLCAGTYTVTLTDHNGCRVSLPVNISQNSALAASSSTTNASCSTCPNGTATVTASFGNPPYTYSWSPGGAITKTDTGLVPGTYTCCVTDGAACQVCEYSITVGYSTSILEYQDYSSFNAFPNPFGNSIHLECSDLLRGGELIISDVFGREVRHLQILSGSMDINTSELPGGMYILCVRSPQGSTMKRLIRE